MINLLTAIILPIIFILNFGTSADHIQQQNINASRSFVIDYENNRFSKNGQPYRYIAGSIHYFRIPSYYWLDRLMKMKAAGLNAIQAYVAWNIHEPTPGNYSFQGDTDLIGFLRTAQKVGLDVILRLGPYTCGEFENGGLPWWLLKIEGIRMRQAHPTFLHYMSIWYSVLLPMLVPMLYENGGPIISMQIENEYGSRPWCDREYLTYLRDLIRKFVGPNAVLFTVDGPGVDYLKCGAIPEVYPTIDFGCFPDKAGMDRAFQALRQYAPRGPLVNTEFYPGWLDTWGYNHSVQDTAPILSSMQMMYDAGVSFNFYMFEGGTNFGYMNGANQDNEPMTTSYDYDAPLTEAGDPTPKLFAIRSLIEQMTGNKINMSVPDATTKFAYGPVPASYLGDFYTLIDTLSPTNTRISSDYPKTFEQIDFPYGFVLYETVSPIDCHQCTLDVPGINDRGHVIIDGLLVGMVRYYKNTSLVVDHVPSGANIRILVENTGRQCSGYNDPKGLNRNVTLNGDVLRKWTIYPINLENVFEALENADFLLKAANARQPSKENFLPSIYYAKFQALQIADTFFNPDGWGRGQFFLNGFNVGRYWPSLGPQVTLYAPQTMIKKLNVALLFELDKPGNCEHNQMFVCNVSFQEKPYVNKTVVGPTRVSRRQCQNPI